jgi:hypothetical protein
VQLRLWKREKFMTEGIREEEEHLQSWNVLFSFMSFCMEWNG